MLFRSAGLPVTEYTFDKTLTLLNNYAYSNNTHWVEANLSWYSPYLLIKQIPFLKRKLFDEAIHLHILKVDSCRLYSQLGYSIGITEIARLGVFVGFESCMYRQVGISVSVPILKSINRIRL